MMQREAIHFFAENRNDLHQVKLYLPGSAFQLKLWESLLRIPFGTVTTYSRIAAGIGHPGAWRAVGTSIGYNPIAYLTPCHRVIQSSGIIRNYHLGTPRKTAMLDWEAAKAPIRN